MPPSFEDRTDFDDADRGFIASLEPGVIHGEDGRVVFDIDAFGFLSQEEPPDTVNPSLWRQSQLCARQGMFEVTDGIYQVRGLDLSNMTLVEGDEGVIVIDPLISMETAAASLALYRRHRGDRPVTGVIYTHSHGDHFGGVRGVATDGVPILAPAGFLEHAVSENVYAGTAMTRRAMYMYGAVIGVGPEALVGTGLGVGTSAGTVTLIAPTLDITETGQEETLDGVRIRFQLTPGTEAPAEMNFVFPDRRALCMAENATHNLHNVQTLRGALVRDARTWARYLDEAITLFGHEVDVAFASHHWPTWGTDRIVAYLSEQRDLYAYLHDQTLRLLNLGYTGIEIAETFELPPALDGAWHARGYYGSVSHNVKAIYHRYLGWFDGNPSSLWELPPEDAAARYVDCMGGADAVVEKARGYLDAGEPRFAAQILKHVVFADDSNAHAKSLLADTYRRLGFEAENATWRNFYLTGAAELETGVKVTPVELASGMAGALTIEQLFDSIAIRVDGPKAWHETFTIGWRFTDLGESYLMRLSNGALTHQPVDDIQADLTLTLTKPMLLAMLASGAEEGVEQEGDPGIIGTLLSVLSEPDPNFNIVTP